MSADTRNALAGLDEVMGLLPERLRNRAKVSEMHGHHSAEWCNGVRFAANEVESALRSHGEAIRELVKAARYASATLGHAYHTALTGELAEHAHTDYQRLDAALIPFTPEDRQDD